MGLEARVARFRHELAVVGGHSIIVNNLRDAFDAVRKIVLEKKASVVALAYFESRSLDGIESVLKEAGVKVVRAAEASKAALAEAQVGITDVEYGVSETGSLILVSSDEADRLVSSLPPTHLALLPANHILPIMSEAFGHIKALLAQRGATNPVVSVITGPSRTSDIELQPVLGVHGPIDLTVLILSEG